MGIGIGLSSSSYDTEPVVIETVREVRLPNPDPKNFRIEDQDRIGDYLILAVRYPDCTNYEGNKILMFKNVTVAELKNQGTLDPHFSNSTKFHSPIARFVPTEEGMEMARTLAFALSKERK